MSEAESQLPPVGAHAFAGQTVKLLVELDQELTGTQTVHFSARRFKTKRAQVHTFDPVKNTATSDFKKNADGSFATFKDFEQLTEWSEPLEPKPGAPRPDSKHTKAVTFEWVAKVGLSTDPVLLPHLVLFSVVTPGTGGLPPVIEASECLLLHAARLTEKPSLRRLMWHEHCKPLATPGGTPKRFSEFDETRPLEVLKGLTPSQRALLHGYPVKKGPDGKPIPRFVTFMTLQDKSRWKPHGADFCQAAKGQAQVFSNMSMSVYRCAGPEEDVILAGHFDQCVINFMNPKTQGHFRQLGAALDPNKADKAPRHAMGVATPHGDAHDVQWYRIFSVGTKGGATDIMSGNYCHCSINTVGCWMLFRNYNWPRASYGEFVKVFKDIWRVVKDDAERTKQATDALAKLGYDKGNFSLGKFSYFDDNPAHIWFAHDILGIKYFRASTQPNDFEPGGLGDTSNGGKPFPSFPGKAGYGGPDQVADLFDPYKALQDWNLDRFVEPGDVEELTRDKRGETLGHNDMDTSSFKADAWDQVWTINAFGDRVCKGYAPFVGPTLTPQQVEERTWCDLYFFTEGGQKVDGLINAWRAMK